MDSQESSNNNFNSLRNSRSLNKKNSATSKKSKKLKKSESQARHQQMTKSELMTQPMRLPGETTGTENETTSMPISSTNQNATTTPANTAMGNGVHQMNSKRVSNNRTPQSFVPSEKMISSGGNPTPAAATQNLQAAKMDTNISRAAASLKSH